MCVQICAKFELATIKIEVCSSLQYTEQRTKRLPYNPDNYNATTTWQSDHLSSAKTTAGLKMEN